MKFTIKIKLITTLCVPLLIMGCLFITLLIHAKNTVIAEEKSNVKMHFSTLVEEKLEGQIDTLALSISDFYEQSKLENIKKDLIVEMSDFRTTLENIYAQKKSRRDAAKNIYTFLNNHRWDNGRYFFAYDAISFIAKAYGSDHDQVGSNGFTKRDLGAGYFVREVIKAAKSNDIGFHEYPYFVPGTSKIEEKLTASFYFKPLNLVVASGEYINVLKQDNINAALQIVATAKYGNNGYFWIQDQNGKILAHPKDELIGSSVVTTKEIAQAIKDKPEAFITTAYENPTTGKTENKFNYARAIFPQWGWTIVTGAYASDITATQDSLTQATNDIFDVQVNFVISSSFLLIVIFFAIVIWIISAIIRRLVLLKERIDTLSTGEADLTSRIKIVNNDELGDIATSVNNFIIYLQSMMLDISQATKHITNSINQLNVQSDQNNQALLAHFAETEQVVSAISELSATSETVSQSATETAVNTQKASDEALLSKSVILEASNSVITLVDKVDIAASSINAMNESTQQIIKVLDVIGEIADQTNLLALNAAIEAARAGEQGRGFAVVADEVRTLAARTQTSTAEINSILTILSNNATSAVSAMDVTKASCERTVENTEKVSVSLDSVTNSIVEINDHSAQIATASEEQKTVSEEVNRNMDNIHQMVQRLTKNGQSSFDSTKDLASANTQLDLLVSQFKI